MKFSCVLVFVSIVEFGSCWVIDNANFQTTLQPKQSRNKLDHYTKSHQESTIKIVVHIDSVLTKRLSKEYGPKTRRKIKILVKETMSEVARIYQNITVNTRLNIKLINTKFLKNNTNIVAMDENSSNYLKSYCTWQAEKKRNTWFYSLLLTGLDLYRLSENGARNRKRTGVSYMRGMCSVRNSCALVEWHPENVAFLIAHEIAHSLGISHDGRPYNSCDARGHMMGSKYRAKNQPRGWSSCSRRAFKKYLASDRAWCLQSNYVNNLTTG